MSSLSTPIANPFWDEVNTNITKKQGKNKHIIIGDINIHLEKNDSNNKTTPKLPKGIKNIIKINSLVDAYKYKNKTENQWTYFQIQNNKVIRSKTDYTLVPIDWEHIWHSPKIYASNKEISQDHRPIGITLRTQIKREFINNIPEQKTKKMNVKELDDIKRQKIKEEGAKIFNSEYWKSFITKSYNELDINQVIQEYEKAIWNVAEKSLEIKEISNIPKLKPKKQSKENIENQHDQNVITKAIFSCKCCSTKSNYTKYQKCLLKS